MKTNTSFFIAMLIIMVGAVNLPATAYNNHSQSGINEACLINSSIPPNPVDRYWENSIPATAIYDYFFDRYGGGIFEVRYKVNGRTLC
ncbi:MAG: hypothetical protein K9G67_02305 [Bacteroidales bacterium]|nr:hypothetical protein [Bacteroidales bacterium]MCF8346297.1 hypothetical protein [Bacteroidales bacterium]MCF8375164.1 hypothetical protein [Bacteroidales bacterium]MCF8401864.1 hypothetical protein [Bacteroidales bacterium]